MRASVGACLFLLGSLTTSASSAAAESARSSFRLEVRAAQGTASCDMEQALHRALPRALGYDPLDPGAAQELLIQVFPIPPAEMAAYVELREPDGTTVWQRLYRQPAGDCVGLVDAVLLGVEVALSAEQRTPALPPPGPCPPLEACPPCPASRCPPETKAQASARTPASSWSISLGAETLFGPLPGVTGGGTLGVAYRNPFVTVGLEGRVTGPATIEIPPGGSTVAFMVAGNLVPCFRGWVFEACAVASTGTLHALGRGVHMPAAKTLFYAAVGPRIAALIPLGERFLLRPYLEVTFPLTPVTLALRRTETWLTPTAGAILGVSAAMSLFPP